MATLKLDAIDRKLLEILQGDSTVPIGDLAEMVGLFQTPCWRRVQRLKDGGVITRNVVLVDRTPACVTFPSRDCFLSRRTRCCT